MSDLLVYGAYGYTGELVAREATDRDVDVVVAGRDADELGAVATELGCESRVFSLSDPAAVEDALASVSAVLNCAGPFAETAEPMVAACLATGTHYLDVTGEIPVFERLAAMDDRAAEAGVTVMPGVGFDVVPTDCLAAHLADRLPAATRLSLGFEASGSLSPGTVRTALRGVGEGGAVRRDGRIESVPIASERRRIDFGNGERLAVTVPWGDVSTAYYTTGIDNVSVYVASSPAAVWGMRAVRLLEPLLASPTTSDLLETLVVSRVEGPDEHERETGRAYVWGEVEAPDGRRVVSRLTTPETYHLTKHAAVTAAQRVLAGAAPAGFQTPGGAFGGDFVLDVAGVERTDDPLETVLPDE